MKISLFGLIAVLFFAACSSESDDSQLNVEIEQPIDLNISRNLSVDENSSHTLQQSNVRIDIQGVRQENIQRLAGLGEPYPNEYCFVLGVTYIDLDDDGDDDIFMAPGDGSENKTPVEVYINHGDGNFTLDTSGSFFFNATPPGLVHPRKIIKGDYNGDGSLDLFISGHGYDQPPYPGEAPVLLLSSSNGFIENHSLDGLVGFHHAATSADIDADGDIDIFITDSDDAYFMINDGNGSFTPDHTRTYGFKNNAFYTTELVDVNSDGYVDLLVAGHEFQGFKSRILWGDSSGFYSINKSTVLPSVAWYGVVVDIDVADLDGDGKKDLLLDRTGSADDSEVDNPDIPGFYRGYYFQVLINEGQQQFSDNTSANFQLNNYLFSGTLYLEDGEAIWPSEATWRAWMRLQDIDEDGDIDIVVDDAKIMLKDFLESLPDEEPVVTDEVLIEKLKEPIWINDGAGSFR